MARQHPSTLWPLLTVLCTLAACSSSERNHNVNNQHGSGGNAVVGGGVLSNNGGVASTGGALGGGGSNTGGGPVGGGGGQTSGTGGRGQGGSTAGSGGVSVGTGGRDVGPIAVDPTPGKWHTNIDPATGRFAFISPEGKPTVVRGVSMTGMETGTRLTEAGAGFWLFQSALGDEQRNSKTVIENVVDVLVDEWQSDVVRIPICGSAWTQDYLVKDWGGAQIAGYKDWVDIAVRRARAAGKVVILDLHLWAVARMSKGTDIERGTFESNGATQRYEDWEDGCTGDNNVDGTDSCAPTDWFTSDRTTWQCAIANADGVTLHSAHKNREHIRDMWVDIANRYRDDSAVWFELFNEPYVRKAEAAYPSFGVNVEEEDYPWDLWTEFMNLSIQGIREQGQASNIILVNGLDWGYSFGPDHGPIAQPDKYLPWKSTVANIAYGFHPYQHGSCCGQIGGSGTDESVDDPYQAGYCAYYPGGDTWGQASGSALPGGASCVQNGYAATQDKKMPPCHWLPSAHNPATGQLGLCGGDRVACSHLDEAGCEALDWSQPSAGGWSQYVLPMSAFGPLIATEFGTFDCSSPYVSTFLRYMREFNISYTAWALWPQDSGGPGGLGACGYPSVMTPSGDGDFRECLDPNACAQLIRPLPWAGQAVYDDLTRP